jgi:hypothetical protein
MGGLLDQVADGRGDPAALRRVRSLIAAVDEQRVAAELHFRTWRRLQIEEVETTFELRVPLVAIPKSVAEAEWAGGGTLKDGGVPTSLRELWERYGVGVEARNITPDPPTEQGEPLFESRQDRPIHLAGTERDHVYTRVPEIVEMRVVKPASSGVVEVGRSRHVVADDRSLIRSYKLETSRLGEKSLSLEFDGDGFVSGIGVEGSSALAAGLAAAAGVTDGFTSGVEGGTKAYNAVRAAGRASIDAELARLKSETETRQQQLLVSELDATAKDSTELKRLTQLQSILDAQTKISGTDPDLVEKLAARAGGDLGWYVTPGPADPPEPTEIRIVWPDGGSLGGGAAPPVAPPGTPPAGPPSSLGTEPADQPREDDAP